MLRSRALGWGEWDRRVLSLDSSILSDFLRPDTPRQKPHATSLDATNTFFPAIGRIVRDAGRGSAVRRPDSGLTTSAFSYNLQMELWSGPQSPAPFIYPLPLFEIFSSFLAFTPPFFYSFLKDAASFSPWNSFF